MTYVITNNGKIVEATNKAIRVFNHCKRNPLLSVQMWQNNKLVANYPYATDYIIDVENGALAQYLN